MEFNSFFADILSTIIGGSILTFLFFLARERIFSLPDVTGKWYFEVETINTAYNPYKGMVLRYIAIIWREGNRLEGTVEKIYENSSTGKRNLIGKKRKRGTVQGYIEKNYLGKDRVQLHVVENGEGRESTTFFELLIQDSKNLEGTFNSMVANSDGVTVWQRDTFKNS